MSFGAFSRFDEVDENNHDRCPARSPLSPRNVLYTLPSSVMVKKKGKSKRVTLKQKFKMEKRVKEHHRRIKKEANRARRKGLAPSTATRKPKDPGIPNDWPHKEDLLKQIERAKLAMEERKAGAQAARKEARATLLAQRRGLVVPGASLPGLAEAAADRGDTFMATTGSAMVEEEAEQRDGSLRAAQGVGGGQQSRRAYLRELRKVVESADVILEVLDARDPMGSRASAVEAAVQANPQKRLVLVLNKVDLVPKDVAAGWLRILRRAHPTVAFKASTQEKVGRGAGLATGVAAEEASAEVLQRGGAVGGEALLNVLKNYARSGDMKTSIAVGVIGYPNTGKSSLINSLKCESVVGTSSVAGHTKAMQEVKLDKNIRLLDSPGIVFDDSDGDATVLRNCVNPDELPDPEGVVAAMLRRCGPEQLMQLYALPRFERGDADAFLSLVSRRLGKMKRGGVPDKASAARAVLRDWNSGRVPYYTAPPKDDAHILHGAAAIVSSFGASFSAKTIMEADAEVLESGDGKGEVDIDSVAFESEASVDKLRGSAVADAIMGGGMNDEDETGGMRNSNSSTSSGSGSRKSMLMKVKQKVSASTIDPSSSGSKDVHTGLVAGSVDTRRKQKATLKKDKKMKRRGGDLD